MRSVSFDDLGRSLLKFLEAIRVPAAAFTNAESVRWVHLKYEVDRVLVVKATPDLIELFRVYASFQLTVQPNLLKVRALVRYGCSPETESGGRRSDRL